MIFEIVERAVIALYSWATWAVPAGFAAIVEIANRMAGALTPWVVLGIVVSFAIVAWGFAVKWTAVIKVKEVTEPGQLNKLKWVSVCLVAAYFLVLAGLTNLALLWWFHGMEEQGVRDFLCGNADKARIIYETRSVSATGQGVLLAACGLAFPLLINLWNDSRKSLKEQVSNHLALLQTVAEGKRQALDRTIKALRIYRDWLQTFGKDLEWLFWTTAGSAMLIVAGSCATYFVIDEKLAYKWAVIFPCLSLVLFLWFLTLIVAFILIVQSQLSRFDHFEFVEE